MTSHAPLLALAAGLAILVIWLGVAFRRYARSTFPTERRRKLSRAIFWFGGAIAIVAYGWLAASYLTDLPSIAGQEPVAVAVAGALLATVPLLVGVVLAMPQNSWI